MNVLGFWIVVWLFFIVLILFSLDVVVLVEEFVLVVVDVILLDKEFFVLFCVLFVFFDVNGDGVIVFWFCIIIWYVFYKGLVEIIIIIYCLVLM